nr:aminotransferase class V-fold PLP-dependent enzyme [Ochrobactrum sp. LMG 5442]
MTDDIRRKIGLRPVINVSGTMTSLGASIVVPEAIEAMAAILPQFVEVNDLQRKASEVIARLTGGEAGFVTASCSSGITLTVAGTMTGNNLLAIERLPDTTPEKNEVLVQTGHVVSYGAPVDQAIRLAGGKVVLIGQATSTHRYHMENAITEKTAAAVYVVSHHVVDYGLLHLSEFVEIAHARGVPVIVDAASEYDLKLFLEKGADIAIYSGHKFLGGPSSGIVAGKKELVRHAFLQNLGIGRGDMAVVERVSHRVAVMYLGEIVEIGPRSSVFENPQHDYTRKLMAAVPIPDPDRRKTRLSSEGGELKSPIRPADFVVPLREYREVSPEHFVALWGT